MDDVKQPAAGAVQIRLSSTPGVNTPGLIRWCQCGWRTERTTRRKQPFPDIVTGYGLPGDIARAILDRTLPFAVEDESIVFGLTADDAARVPQAMTDLTDEVARQQRFRAAQARVRQTIETLRQRKDASTT